jgi:hypothetical protein
MPAQWFGAKHDRDSEVVVVGAGFSVGDLGESDAAGNVGGAEAVIDPTPDVSVSISSLLSLKERGMWASPAGSHGVCKSVLL